MASNENCPTGERFISKITLIKSNTVIKQYFYLFTESTGAVFKRNGFNTDSRKEPIIRDHALLNANEDDEMVS